MKKIQKQLKRLIGFINYFVRRDSNNFIAIQYDRNNDIGDIGEYFLNIVSGNIDIFLEKKRLEENEIDYTIKIVCEKADEDDIVIDSSRLFTEREAVITFKVRNTKRIEILLAYKLRDWAYQFAKWRENRPSQLIMCIPPDLNDPNYREHMNTYIKNKIEGNI